MPNPEQLITAAKLGAEMVEANAPHLVAKLPGLIELSAKAHTTSLLEPGNRALLETAAKLSGNDVPSMIMRAAEKTGVPLEVDPSRIAAVRESLIGNNPAAIDASLTNAFTPRTYAENRMFYGG